MKKKERVLITGGGGMLGQDIFKVFSDLYENVLATDIDLNEKWLTYMDVREITNCEIIFKKFKPEIVIHLAALTDLEYCETHTDDTLLTNALGTENITLLSKKYDSLMLYVSTAGIFKGDKEFYTDFDKPDPINCYGKSKYYGECFVGRNIAKHYIFRAGWMMGGGLKKDKKFVKKIFDQIKDGKKELFVVDDKLGTPTYTLDFAKSVSKVIESGYYGLYNQVCNGSGSRLDVAKKFIEFLGLSDNVKITKVSSDYFKDEYFAPRPNSEKLINLKLISRGINYMREWKTCLKEYSIEYKKDYYKK